MSENVVGETADRQGVEEISPKDKAEFAYRLGQCAWERFQGRRNYEWKLSLGLWAGLGSAAGLVWTSRGVISVYAAVATLFLTLLIIFVYFLMINWMHKTNYRDMRTSYWWETVISHCLMIPRCEGLRPDRNLDKWPSYPEDADLEGEPYDPWRFKFHIGTLCMLCITTLLAFLFLTAVFSKTWPASTTSIDDPDREPALSINREVHNRITIEPR